MAYMNSTDCDCNAAAPRRRFDLAHLRLLLAVWQQRRALARLTPAQRADVGISEKDAQCEANRAVWDVPAGWRQ